MTNKEKWKELTDKGFIICVNWVRGCWEETITYKKCEKCREKERIREKNNRDNKKKESLEFNKNSNNTKKCEKCSKEVTNDNFNIETNKCNICYNKNKQLNNLRNPRDKIKAKMYDYKKSAKHRNIEFELSDNEFMNMIQTSCYYCGNIDNEGCLGIDRIDSSKCYNKDNCVPCCSTCNIMKLNYTKKSFLDKCLSIIEYKYNKYDNLENEIISFFDKYSNNKTGIKRSNPTFFHSKDFYEYRKWNSNSIEDIKKIEIELEFVENSDQKDIWNYYRWTISSLKTFSPTNFVGRIICILVKDKITNKYLGIMSLSSDIMNMMDRDKAIGWSNEEKINNKKLNLLMNLSTCVSIQPFGFNFNGGKLIAKLAFSKEIMEKFEEKFNQKLLAIVTTGLYGKSIQYDRLTEIKQVGMTKGNSIYWIPEIITSKCREYLKRMHKIDVSKYKKLEVITKIISILGLDKEEILDSNKKGIYLGFTRPDSKEYLCGTKNIINDYQFKPAQIIFKEWLDRWSIQRYNHLIKMNKFIKYQYEKSTAKVNRHNEKLKKDLGEEGFKNLIKAKNAKTYNNKISKVK